jgi:hypothetical protein
MPEEIITKEMRQARIGLVINGLLISSMLIAMLYCQKRKAELRKSINANPKYGSAELIKIRTGNTRGGGPKTYFTFAFSTPQGQWKTTNMYSTLGRKITLDRNCYPFLIGRRFPTIYSEEHPEKPKVLFLRYDFNRKGLSFPDSLKWTENIIYTTQK